MRSGGSERVYCWMGDMTYETGMAHECMKYGQSWDLPIRWIVEDNEKSVCTDTGAVWGPDYRKPSRLECVHGTAAVEFINYESKWPHAGAGRRVQF